MRHEITSLNTKKALAGSLKKILLQKPFSKITVSEIIRDCDVNRKTFYYHFQDIFALLKWTLDEEAVNVVKNFDLLTDYREAMVFVMDYVENNKYILNCIYDSVGREELKRFFNSDFKGVIRQVIDGVKKEFGLQTPADFEDFLCEVYTAAIVDIIIEWFQNKGGDREKTLRYVWLFLRSTLPAALGATDKNYF